MLVLLHAGQMIAIPLSRDLVGTIGGERNLGSYYGFLNSFGGVMVLLSSLVVGLLLDDAATSLKALITLYREAAETGKTVAVVVS